MKGIDGVMKHDLREEKPRINEMNKDKMNDRIAKLEEIVFGKKPEPINGGQPTATHWDGSSGCLIKGAPKMEARPMTEEEVRQMNMGRMLDSSARDIMHHINALNDRVQENSKLLHHLSEMAEDRHRAVLHHLLRGFDRQAAASEAIIARLDVLDARLDIMEKRMMELARRPAPPTADGGLLDREGPHG